MKKNSTPVSIKKWISISDEVVDLRGEAFLRYIYDEITYRIAKKCNNDKFSNETKEKPIPNKILESEIVQEQTNKPTKA